MDKLSEISRPIAVDLERYKLLFDKSMTHEDGLLGRALEHIKERKGKMMRPILVLLVARDNGEVGEASLRSAVTLELLHTASLVHDDVVDESSERRGQLSSNALYGNKVAVLLGDYLLSDSLHLAAATGDLRAVDIIAQLGHTLSAGEIFQLSNVHSKVISEEAYFNIVKRKTAALFAACAQLGAITSGASENYIEKARLFGEIVGICFQIRDDIFDYFDDADIGKPTGHDMREGKLTLPIIYALQNTTNFEIHKLAIAVKNGTADDDGISRLVAFAKENGGIQYAEKVMQEYREKGERIIAEFNDESIKSSLS